MRIIGITGGVGAGKSEILNFIGTHYSCRIIRADEAAHMVERPGEACYEALVSLLGKDILQVDLSIDKGKMAAKIFADHNILVQVNGIVHPAVKQYIKEQITLEEQKGEYKYFFIEAALLIEEHYEKIVDELWYIHTDEAIRAKRLQASRQYTDEKTESIMKKQLSEKEFRKHCQVVITNNDDLEETHRQIIKVLGE